MCHTNAMITLVEYGTRCLCEDTNFYSVLIVRSACWLKLKSFHFRKCCEEIFICVSGLCRIAWKHFQLRLRAQKAQPHHYWQMGGKNLKYVNHYNFGELYWILTSQMTKTFRDNCDKNIVQQTSCEPLFPDVQMQLKMYIFVPFVRPCMHNKYGGISESHACKDCVWPIILDAELHTTCPGERVLVVMTHQVQCTSDIPTFEALRKNMYLFLERCRRSNHSSSCARFGAGRSRFDSRLSAGSYQDLINWYRSLLIRRTVCGRAAENTFRTQNKPEIVQTQSWRYKTIVLVQRQQQTPISKKKFFVWPSSWTDVRSWSAELHFTSRVQHVSESVDITVSHCLFIWLL